VVGAEVKPLAFREALYELRRTRLLYTDGKITRHEWCASVHRILAAFSRGRARADA
jgi:hypothetical protein